jgi:HSP20 family molecular chaperone IbpA
MFPWNFTPFNKDTIKKLQQMRPEEIEKYVNEMLGKMMPAEMQEMDFTKGSNPFNISAQPTTQKFNQLEANVFETHDDVYVIIQVKNKNDVSNMRIFHTSNQLIIEHFPEAEDKHTITLPAIVKRKGARASYKEGTLEIKLPKSIHLQYTEIDIREYE